ncbi:MAG: hypothetical protein E6G28_01785 [Actinobacteria bacterium]|nr:MAG: hypothetical protein E6G28_01785 [Actinomycetota bacterium]
MRALLCPASLKGALSARSAAAALARGFREQGGVAVELPVADGGEGTADVLERAGCSSGTTGRWSRRRPQSACPCSHGRSATRCAPRAEDSESCCSPHLTRGLLGFSSVSAASRPWTAAPA